MDKCTLPQNGCRRISTTENYILLTKSVAFSFRLFVSWAGSINDEAGLRLEILLSLPVLFRLTRKNLQPVCYMYTLYKGRHSVCGRMAAG